MTKNDCRFDYFRGTGKGGQKRNKTSSGVRCIHIASGAIGVSDDTRSQHDNKVIAFRRMYESKAFQDWHKIETMRKLGMLADIDTTVDRQMKNILVENRVDGKWVPSSHPE